MTMWNTYLGNIDQQQDRYPASESASGQHLGSRRHTQVGPIVTCKAYTEVVFDRVLHYAPLRTPHHREPIVHPNRNLIPNSRAGGLPSAASTVVRTFRWNFSFGTVVSPFLVHRVLYALLASADKVFLFFWAVV